MNIAIDFDNTLTADPKLWGNFIASAKTSGHRVICITARRDTDENREELQAYLEHWGLALPTFYTGLSSKIHWAKKNDIKIDIWIDDDPTTLVNGH